jgi:hypothetical protein
VCCLNFSFHQICVSSKHIAPLSAVLLKTLTDFQMLDRFHCLYGTWTLIILFTWVRYLTLPEPPHVFTSHSLKIGFKSSNVSLVYKVKSCGRKICSCRSSLFWDVTQHWLVVSYPHFGTAYRSHLQGSSSPRKIWCCSYFVTAGICSLIPFSMTHK